MYPVLVVDGKELRVKDVNYNSKNEIDNIGVIDGHNYISYYDFSSDLYTEDKLKIDMKTALKWVNRYKEVLEDIEMVIEEKYDLMTTIAHQEMYRRKELPFADKKNEDMYFQKEREMIGLHHAKEIVEKFVD